MEKMVSSSDVLILTLQLETCLSHVQFRLLRLIGDYPNGDCFSADVDRILERGRMHIADLEEAVLLLRASTMLKEQGWRIALVNGGNTIWMEQCK